MSSPYLLMSSTGPQVLSTRQQAISGFLPLRTLAWQGATGQDESGGAVIPLRDTKGRTECQEGPLGGRGRGRNGAGRVSGYFLDLILATRTCTPLPLSPPLLAFFSSLRFNSASGSRRVRKSKSQWGSWKGTNICWYWRDLSSGCASTKMVSSELWPWKLPMFPQKVLCQPTWQPPN